MIITNIISFLYKHFLKKILFLFYPEFIHNVFLFWGELFGKIPPVRWLYKLIFSYQDSSLSQEIFGLTFRNPVGIGAGFDKDARMINIISDIGLGHTEIGTATLIPYEGNPKPRLIRLIKDKSIVVNYGFKNEGIRKILKKINKSSKKDMILGLSIGKTNSKETTDLENSIKDQVASFKLAIKNENIDYLTLNISCPNTFGGQPFTNKERFEKLIRRITKLNIDKPLFIKMPVNIELSGFDKLLKLCVKYKVDGVIIGNLNKDRRSYKLLKPLSDDVKGGLSGLPTKEFSNKLIAYTYKNYGKELKIIGIGGIFSAEDAYEKIKLGASLVQLITGLIFEGPQLIYQINKGIAEKLKKDGFKNISEAIGIENNL